MMNKLLLATLATAATLPLWTTPAAARPSYREQVRECNRELRRDTTQRDYYSDLRQCQRQLATYRQHYRNGNWQRWSQYDYNRPEPGQQYYYPDRYYRTDPSYQPYTLSRNDRVYRGQDGRYYCRRSDGTTGLIVGGALGGVIGSQIAPGHSGILGALLGAGAGAAIGSSIDSGNVRCN